MQYTMPYAKGDRVQATRYYILNQKQSVYLKHEGSVGIFDGYKGKHTQVTHCWVRWLNERQPYPPEFRQICRLRSIEPLGARR